MAPQALKAVAPPETAPATFINVRGQNDGYWRCEAPARAVGARTELITQDEMNDVLMYPHDTEPFRWHIHVETQDGPQVIRHKRDWQVLCNEHKRLRLNSFWIELPDLEGAAVWIRPCTVRMQMAAQMQEHGHRTIAEWDDNYISNPKHSAHLRDIGWDETSVDEHLKTTCFMDAVVFSTEHLRDVYDFEIRRRWRKWFPGPERPPKPELYVCGNHVDERDWPEVIERDGPIRVGWMGSASHIHDVDLIWGAMMYATQNGAETWMIGYNPASDPEKFAIKVNGRAQLSEREWERMMQWAKVGAKGVEWRDLAPYERFALPLDIGLCPLLTNEMTLGKSDVKFIEYTISGAATIAMNNLVYNRTIIHGETGLLVGSDVEMVAAVKLLMGNEKLRLELVANAQQYVREERGGKQMRDEWMEAING